MTIFFPYSKYFNTTLKGRLEDDPDVRLWKTLDLGGGGGNYRGSNQICTMLNEK
jgi:hypothetical protein